jgi:hypothetical protein
MRVFVFDLTRFVLALACWSFLRFLEFPEYFLINLEKFWENLKTKMEDLD